MEPQDKDQLITWARTRDWDVFATPSFRYPVTTDRAFQAVEHWLRPFRAYALVARHMGEAHAVHLLIGGIPQSAYMLGALRDTWQRGNLHLDRFHPRGGAIAYLINRADAIDLIGTPKVYRP